VRDAVEQGKSLSDLTPEELRQHSELLDGDYYEVLRRESWIESKRIAGGTGSEAVAAQLDHAGETLAAIEARLATEER
jgi:argininosuccinate lyase